MLPKLFSTTPKRLLRMLVIDIKQSSSKLNTLLHYTSSFGVYAGDNHLFPFLLAVEKMMNTGFVSRDEWQLFTRMSADNHVDVPQGGDVQMPHWVSQQVWDAIDDLELLPVFSGLKQSVTEQSEQWREYFNVSDHT